MYDYGWETAVVYELEGGCSSPYRAQSFCYTEMAHDGRICETDKGSGCLGMKYYDLNSLTIHRGFFDRVDNQIIVEENGGTICNPN